VTQLGYDLHDAECPFGTRLFGCTLFAAVTRSPTGTWPNGPNEAVNRLIKRVMRATFGSTSVQDMQIRSLNFADKRHWEWAD
jgi:hypothetical protein